MLLPLLLTFLGSAGAVDANVVFWEVDQLEAGVIAVRDISPSVGVRDVSSAVFVKDASAPSRIYEVS